MSLVKVSVVVPVYNVENYIEKCLQSLADQTLPELEVLVIDDGSTDGSAAIAGRFADAYPCRFKIYSKPNGGLSDARNFGMRFVQGEYVGFVDSDDYVDPQMYEVMYRKAKEEDYQIVECNLHHTFRDYEDTEVGEEITDKKRLLMDGRSVVWNKIYNREWLQSLNVTFHAGVIYEDVEFFLKLVPFIERYAYVEDAFVHYVQREASINNASSLKTLDILTILDEIKSYYIEKGFFEEYESALEYFFARILLCSSFLRMCGIADATQRKEALQLNYSMLTKHFPEWRRNPYLRENKSRKGLFMKCINQCTYHLCSFIFPGIYQLKKRKQKGT